MMTTTERLTALNMIMRGIDRDLDNDPNFTLTESQLRFRIDDYIFDDPNATDADSDAIMNCALTFDRTELPLRD